MVAKPALNPKAGGVVRGVCHLATAGQKMLHSERWLVRTVEEQGMKDVCLESAWSHRVCQLGWSTRPNSCSFVWRLLL